MNILESLSIFYVKNDSEVLSVDSTLYKIKTMPHEYVGRIVYQDDNVIKFKKEMGTRLVKILKCNIESITVLQA